MSDSIEKRLIHVETGVSALQKGQDKIHAKLDKYSEDIAAALSKITTCLYETSKNSDAVKTVIEQQRRHNEEFSARQADTGRRLGELEGWTREREVHVAGLSSKIDELRQSQRIQWDKQQATCVQHNKCANDLRVQTSLNTAIIKRMDWLIKGVITTIVTLVGSLIAVWIKGVG